MNLHLDAIFTTGLWLIIFPAMIVGLCLWSLIFLTVERHIVTGAIWYTFIVRDVLWIAVAVRQVFILDEMDIVVSVLLLAIACLFAMATVLTYQEARRRIALRKVAEKRVLYLESLYTKDAHLSLTSKQRDLAG